MWSYFSSLVSWVWPSASAPTEHEHVIRDRYTSVPELQAALAAAGLESCNLIVALDYTGSNVHSGTRTFGGRCLHALSDQFLNPYQSVLAMMGRTLEAFDDDKLIPVYGFGDATTKDKGVFSLTQDGRPCNGFQEALRLYEEVTPKVVLSGPTSFAPAIRAALRIVKDAGAFHLLVIIADGQVTVADATEKAIVEASEYPLAILIVGVGDGPWDEMERYDDELPERRFDNLQFINFHEVMTRYDGDEVAFTTRALAELPQQYREIRRLKLLHPPRLV
jgi:hypothetical protein